MRIKAAIVLLAFLTLAVCANPGYSGVAGDPDMPGPVTMGAPDMPDSGGVGGAKKPSWWQKFCRMYKGCPDSGIGGFFPGWPW